MPIARHLYGAHREPAPSARSLRLLRIASATLWVAVGGACALLLIVRFLVFPQVESHRGAIAAYLSQRVGQTVEIESIVTGWEGWNPRLSIRGVTVRDRAGLRASPLLDLPRVDLIVAWTSLPLFELRLRELVIDGPRLAVRRDAQGRLRIAGIALEPGEPEGDAAITEWFLHQRQIVVQNALITWDDELRNAPQLVLDQVQFRLERGFGGHHRFGLTGTPPAELAAPVDVRGDVQGFDANDWQKTRGRFYVRLDYADVAAWREWLPLPLPVESGKGALRLWLDVDGGKLRDVVADLELADVDTRLETGLPPLALAHLAGRVGWRQDDKARTLYTKGFAFRTREGLTLPPTDFTLTVDGPPDASTGGRLAFPRLDLAPLAAIAAHLPLPERVRRDLARFAPRGTLVGGHLDWEGPADAPRAFATAGAFERLGITAQELFPGADGVSGSFEATQARGTLKLASQSLTLALPRVFAEPLVFDSANGNVRWERNGDALAVTVADFAFANAHTSGSAAGTWHSSPSGPGTIDMKAQLVRGTAENVYRYLPLKLNEQVRDWVRRALVRGTASDARLTVKGDLAEFPFAQGKGGQFLVTAKAQGVTLDFADGWPPLTDVDADLRFDGTRMTVAATRARVNGTDLARARAEVADMADPQPVLRVSGEATGATREVLAFIAQSPVAGYVEHFSDHVQANGPAHVALKFDMPVKAPSATKVAGELTVTDNELRIDGVPPLTRFSGKLAFTEHDVSAEDLAGEAFNGPVKARLSGSDGRIRIDVAGTTNVAYLRPEIDSPLADRISGTVDWTLQANVRPDAVSWTLESPLRGVAVDLPAPLGKAAADTVALRVERHESAPPRHDDVVTVDYGSVARVELRAPAGTAGKFDRGLVTVGKVGERAGAGEADRAGLWLRADLPALDVDDWLAVGRLVTPADAGAVKRGGESSPRGMRLEGADLHAGLMQVLGRRFDDLKLSARRNGDDWRLALDGTQVNGTAVWRAPTPIMPNGRVVARLARLASPAAGDLVAWQAPVSASAQAAPAPDAANPWPEIDVASDAFWMRGRDVGKLEFNARPMGVDWRIERMALSNDFGSIQTQGWWRAGPPQQTTLDVAIETQEAGAFLGRFGMADAVRGAPTKIAGQVSWAGSPADFDYGSVKGSFKLDVGPGQFLKVDPGVGRLLGVLSLQSLPRRITLDFRDVFSEGFAFDSIAGASTIAGGVISTDNLKLAGPAANVDISGSADIPAETQVLRVKILPALSSTLSAGAAALFLANPLIGAAVGAGTLLAQKLLNNPLEQLFSYEYTVTGSWSDPHVERVSSRTASTTAAPAAPSQ